MQPPVNYLAVLVAALSSMVLGYLWYGPLFGKLWMKLSGLKMGSGAKDKMGMLYGIATVGAFIEAYILSHVLVFASSYMNTSGLSAGLSSGFWMWLGFVATVTLGNVLWYGHSWKLWGLENAYYLTSLLIMGSILALWQ